MNNSLIGLAIGFTALTAFLHLYFLVLEMFLWTTPKVRAGFKMTEEFAKASQVLAKNQGLYNGFIAAGLILSFVLSGDKAMTLRVFCLGCAIVAGVYGATTVSKKIFYVQALPAAIALALTGMTCLSCSGS